MAALNEPVKTEYGLLTAVTSAQPSVRVYRGIPYAASTAGENRWCPPRLPQAWDGVRHAAQFGDVAPQEAATGSLRQSEDCLNLNVWSAASAADERRPVLVWIHGGRFLFGSGSDPGCDGAELARQGLVVVTINVRLGVLGFLATAELSEESGHAASGNYALLDAIAALSWVRRNIAAFGGDPDRITIAGQSSGAATVLDLVYSPLAAGLFHRVIAQSAALYPKDPAISTLAPSHRGLEQAERDGDVYGRARGARTLRELRGLPLPELLAGSSGNDPSVPGTPPPPLFRPVIDGHVLPRSYWESLTLGLHADVPVLVGGNRDESGVRLGLRLPVDEYERSARTVYGELAERYLGLYPATTPEQAGDQANAARRDAIRTSTHLWAAEWAKKARSPVFTYHWTHVPPGSEAAERGAFHGSEIPYIFGNLNARERPYAAPDAEISRTLSAYVVNFADAGDPNGPGLPVWAPARADALITHQVGAAWGPMPVAGAANAALIKEHFDRYPAW